MTMLLCGERESDCTFQRKVRTTLNIESKVQHRLSQQLLDNWKNKINKSRVWQYIHTSYLPCPGALREPQRDRFE